MIWPMTADPWVLGMEWNDLAFLNWPVDAPILQATLPPGVHLDTFGGQAWLSAVPFWMVNVAPRGVQAWSSGIKFTELNLRTYVVVQGEPGVWFYSLDAAHPLVVCAARQFVHLPYLHARMWHERQGKLHRFASERTHPAAPTASFAAAYRPAGEVFHARPGTLDHWLTDRLCFYTASRGRLYRGRVDHGPWPLQPARCEIRLNTLGGALGLPLNGEPHALYSEQLTVRARILERVR